MPIYEYQCEKCQEHFDKFVRNSEDQAEVTCPKCGAKDVKKKLSLFGCGPSNSAGSGPASSCGPT